MKIKRFLIVFTSTLIIFSLLVYSSGTEYTTKTVIITNISDRAMTVETKEGGVIRIDTLIDISGLVEVNTEYRIQYSQKKLFNKTTLMAIRQ